MSAREKLRRAQKETGSLLSVGLEPSAEYFQGGANPNLQEFEEFLSTIIEATRGIVCAYKVNLAFFEAHGWEGMELLYTLRETIPENALLIADAKRSDIGTTSRHYATALFGKLEADAVTVNPLMGRDSVEPFLEWSDRLTFLLALTSNPGAEDFLLRGDLFLEIARRAREWSRGDSLGFVAGATRGENLARLREAAGPVPFLVPGLGAQGGDLDEVFRQGAAPGDDPCLLLHLTRGILPAAGEPGNPEEIIRRKTEEWNARVASAGNPIEGKSAK